MNDQEELFEGEKTSGKKGSFPKRYLGAYDAFEVVSAFVKSIRLKKVEDAIYWMTVMIEGGAPLTYIARRLCIESQESGYGPTPAIYADAVFRIVSVGGGQAQDSLFQLTVYLASCKKWWEEDAMRPLVRKWYVFEKECQDIQNGETNEYRDIPSYALDVHTRRGKQMKKRGCCDERFSGSEKGVFSIMTLYEKNGRLDENDYLTPDEERTLRDGLYKNR